MEADKLCWLQPLQCWIKYSWRQIVSSLLYDHSLYFRYCCSTEITDYKLWKTRYGSDTTWKTKSNPATEVAFGNISVREKKSLPERERLRVCKLPHPVHSENLDHAVKLQSSLQGTWHLLLWGGKGPAHCRHSVIFANSPLSPMQLIPENGMEGRNQQMFFMNILFIVICTFFTCSTLTYFECKGQYTWSQIKSLCCHYLTLHTNKSQSSAPLSALYKKHTNNKYIHRHKHLRQ